MPHSVKFLRRLLAAMLLSMAGISQAGWPARAQSEPGFSPPDGVAFEADLPYRAGNPRWGLDIARPVGADALLPAVIIFHGGAWRFGNKDHKRGLACRFAQEGFVGVTAGYRLADEAPFPACVDDAVLAVRWVRAHAAEHGIDPHRLGVYGLSAGGHLAAMVGLAEPSGGFAPGQLEEFAGPVQGVVALAPPADFRFWDRDGGDNTGVPALLKGADAATIARASPATFAAANSPPLLVIQGSADTIVPPIQSERLVRALRSAGAHTVERVLIDGLPHNLVMPGEFLIWPQVLAFFRITLGEDPDQIHRAEVLTSEWETLDRMLGVEGERARRKWWSQFDRDGDGRVTLEENPGTPHMFERSDRGRRGWLPVREEENER